MSTTPKPYEVLDHGSCHHCDQPIELKVRAGEQKYWYHENGAMACHIIALARPVRP